MQTRAKYANTKLVPRYSLIKIIIVLKQNKLEIWGKAQRESAGRPKSDWWKIRGGGKISSAPKSHGPNSNALAYAERALST